MSERAEVAEVAGTAGAADAAATRAAWDLPLLLLTAAALLLRAWGAFDLQGYYQDESFQVPSAINLSTFHAADTVNWTHPPLGALILGATIDLLGNGPAGWRLGGVLLGTASVALLYLVALELYRDRTAALLAGLLLAVDPFHVYYSRGTMMEIPVVAFFLLFLLLALRWGARGGTWTLAGAGAALGLTMASKGYYVFAAPLVAGWAARERWRAAGDRRLLLLEAAWGLALLPAATYLACHWHFFARGGSLAEFLVMQADAVRVIGLLTRESFVSPWLLDAGGPPWTWFLLPSAFGISLGDGRHLVEHNFFPIRPLGLIAMAALLWRDRRAPTARRLAPPVLFAAVHSLFLGLERPMIAYSAMAALPFAHLSLARAIGEVDASHPRRRPALLAGALIAAWGLTLYPMATGHRVPAWLQVPFLRDGVVTEARW